MRRKAIPGLQFFICDECRKAWQEPSRDCQSQSTVNCPDCNSDTLLNKFELKPEWQVDEFGNLIEGKEYK